MNLSTASFPLGATPVKAGDFVAVLANALVPMQGAVGEVFVGVALQDQSEAGFPTQIVTGGECWIRIANGRTVPSGSQVTFDAADPGGALVATSGDTALGRISLAPSTSNPPTRRSFVGGTAPDLVFGRIEFCGIPLP